MRWSEIEAIPCPVAQAMSVIGDAWTMLILRDALRGATKFEEFQRSTRASRAVLSDRLSGLVDHGVMERSLYEDHPPRHDYRLTKRGRALQPVLMSLSHWSEMHLPKPTRPVGRRHTVCGRNFTPIYTCSECGEEVTPETVAFDRPLAHKPA